MMHFIGTAEKKHQFIISALLCATNYGDVPLTFRQAA
jgi:hypothetical protein